MSTLLPDFEGVICDQLKIYLTELMTGAMTNPLQVVQFGDDTELTNRYASISASVSHTNQAEHTIYARLRAAQITVGIRLAKIPQQMAEIVAIRRCIRTALERLGEARNTHLAAAGFTVYDIASQLGYDEGEISIGDQPFVEMQFVYQLHISYNQ